ncbi:MAG: hypothetical protein JRI71_02750 [Deltaproteobacteria bacterium]|nr:hypothetical protein [Deltaproteobacteria bacterium]
MVEFRKVVRDGIEYRFDPLTDEQTRINPARAKRLRQAESDVEWEGIIDRCGETVVFPNLNPFGENHAVATLSEAHFLDVDEFRVDLLRDNLLASREYILSVWNNNKEARWPIWVWNYMPPSAGSIIHPHVQILVEGQPVPQLKELLARGEAYFHDHRRNYWGDLVSKEQELDERFIYGDDALAVITSFAPRGFNEIQFIFRESSLEKLAEGAIDAFAHAITKALCAYKEIGIGSFNLITYSGPLHEELDYYALHTTLFSRPPPRGVYTNDTGPMERGYDVWVIDTVPEELADRMKPFFA